MSVLKFLKTTKSYLTVSSFSEKDFVSVSVDISLKWRSLRMCVCSLLFLTTVHPIYFTLGEGFAGDPRKHSFECEVVWMSGSSETWKEKQRNLLCVILRKRLIKVESRQLLHQMQLLLCDFPFCFAKMQTVHTLNTPREAVMDALFSNYQLSHYILNEHGTNFTQF